ncbi:C-type lectin domain family 2 member B-like [Hemicordylus capensis]|uniref:C-type lectin domain family 2 member B-like n=1 Tax=Hemicordylus capensis TaxID=884348 RepID=UPI002303F8C5|nr:C-type lectin domain family 2 member B-like [Hemicordylus capensis]
MAAPTSLCLQLKTSMDFYRTCPKYNPQHQSCILAVLAQSGSDCTSRDLARPPCPHDWIGYRGKCYYFSVREQNWTASQSFCSSQDASLASIRNEEENFVIRNKGKHPCWVGLRRDRDQTWRWLDGKNATLKVLGEGGDADCAYLNDEAKPSASRCIIEHRWICSKPMN